MMDPAKLKVVELRAELSKRGLETKGNKPVLVERLRKALEDETDHTTGEETANVEAPDESMVESPHKHTRDKTPEPLTCNRTPGRSSRSSSVTTPTKVSPAKGVSKVLSTPIAEKHVSPTKSSLSEKTEKISETITETFESEDANSETIDDTPIVERREEEPVIVEPADTVEETPKDASVDEPIVSEVTKTDAEEIQPETEQSVPETEEKVSTEENEESPEATDDQVEANSHTEPELLEDTSRDTNEGDDDTSNEQTVPKETILQNENIVNDEPTEMEEVGDNDESRDFAEPMESTADAGDQEENTVETETKDTNADSSEIRETTEATSEDAAPKDEVDERSNADDASPSDEKTQDVEMKEEKDETESNLKRDAKDDRKDRIDRKRKRSSSPQEERVKSPLPTRTIDEPDLNETDVVLSWYDSDLNLLIDKENLFSATAMHNDGFGYIWAGARASCGFAEGKIFYEAKITVNCDVNLQDEKSPHVLRVGWSAGGTSMQLGEGSLSYGFDGTGKMSTDNNFCDYGRAFGKDDVVGCYLDFTDDDNVVMTYTINGEDMGPAFTISKNILDGKPLYPHVLAKNCTFHCNFGQEKPWCEILDGFVAVGATDPEKRVHGPHRPDKIEDCEIIMLCGLPAAGKTSWATKYAEEHPDKLYNILGTNSLIEKMKVEGLSLRQSFPGGQDTLMDKCTKCLNKLLELACTRRRNYIFDETNVTSSAQRRKMRNFHGYQRRAVVVVPTEEEFKARIAKKSASDSDVTPDSTVLTMKASFNVPVVGDTFDVVEWAELPAEEGKQLIEKYNKEGKEAGYGQQQPSKRPRFERNDNHRDSRDGRQSSRDSRDNRDHRDRRNSYSDRNRNSTWRGGSNSGGWRDRQPRPAGGHTRHGGSNSSGSGYGSQSGWRSRAGNVAGPPASYRPSTDRRVVSGGHDRRTSGMDRNRSASSRQGDWRSMNSYQGSQSSGNWGGSSQSGNWQGSQSQQQGCWDNQLGSWGQQQQWGSWKGYGQGNSYSQGNYSQQGYGNGNWNSWNQQYYNQYWGQQQQSGSTSAAGSQAGHTSSSGATGNSTSSTGPSYSNYSSTWQSYPQSYGYSTESSNANTQQQK